MCPIPERFDKSTRFALPTGLKNAGVIVLVNELSLHRPSVDPQISNRFLRSTQVKRTPQDYINEFIIRKLNPLVVVDFRFMSAFFHA